MGEEGCIEDEKFFNLETSNFLIKKGNKDILTNDFNDNIKSETNLIITDSNRIGIGKENPEYSLDVNGDINITGNYLQNGSILKTGYWEESDNKIYYDLGNVGIGTTDPQEKLEVMGNANIYGNITTKILNQFTENEIKSITSGSNHSMILLNTGKVLSFGLNNKGQLGDGSTISQSNVPLAVDSANGYTQNNAIAIAGGFNHSMILLNTGKVLSFGNNGDGQLGDGSTISQSNVPIAVDSANGYTQDNAIAIAGGTLHSMILLNTGKVLSFGSNQYGQLGNSSSDSSNVPIEVDSANGYTQDNAIAIATGSYHSMILLNTGKVLSFGRNNRGQLGDGTGGNTGNRSNVPVTVSTTSGVGYNGSNAIAIATGSYHSMILLNTGKVLSFGYNQFGILGNGTNISISNVPDAVRTTADYDGSNAIAIAGGGKCSMILLNTRKVLSFGLNTNGELGDNQNSGNSSKVPVEVNSSNGYTQDNAIAIACGNNHSMILLNTGKVLSFGLNFYAQLGDGTINLNSLVPVAVDSANGYIQDNLKTIYNTFEIGGNFNNAITNNYLEIYTESKYLSTDDAETKSFSGFYPNHLNIKNKKSSSKIQFLNSNDEVDLSIGTNQIELNNDVNISNTTQSTDSSTGALVVSGGVGIAKNTYIGGHLNIDSDINITGNYLQNGSILKTGYWEESDNKIYYDLGNVGIGTTDPQEKLEVNGNANIYGNITTKILNQFTENEIKSIACGGNHSMILLNTGKVLSFGSNDYGQLGDSSNDSSNILIEVDSSNGYDGENAIAIACGGGYSMILLNTGKVLSFGYNVYGQLGDGTNTDSNVPVAVSTSSNVGYDGENAIAIAAGSYHSMILLNTGKVLSFGSNDYGQLGDESTDDSSNVPVEVDSANGYTQDNAIAIACGGLHSMILLNTGKVLGFGWNSSGQLGDGNGGSESDSSNVPVEVDSANGYTQDNAIAIACGEYHSMILLNTGKVLSFGRNRYSQLGNGTNNDNSNAPVAVSATADYDGENTIAISCGGNHSIILLNTGKVLLFGRNNYGQLGDGSTTERTVPVVVSTTSNVGYDGSNTIAIAGGNLHSMILLNTGKVLSFGINSNGELGDGTNTDSSNVPVEVGKQNNNFYDGSNVNIISTGGNHSIILLNTGKVLSFGWNEYGQLGDGSTDDSNVPIEVESFNGYTQDNAIAIAGGNQHSMILLNTGKVLSFGWNNNGQLGDGTYGTYNNRTTPVEVDSANGYTQDNAIAIAGGYEHSIILLNTGKVLSFGRNDYGQLGDSSNTNRNKPVEVDSANGYTQDNAIAIAGGYYHSMILLNTGKVLSFGDNQYGQLGDNKSSGNASYVPIEVDSANGYTQDNAIAIACGQYHSIILLNTGKVLSFGLNLLGQLGNIINNSNVPIEVDSANGYTQDNAIAITAGSGHSMILLNTGKVVSFGFNSSGQLGVGSNNFVNNVPVEVDSANGYTQDNAIAIAGGNNHSMILLNTGKVLSFGWNFYGQLGDGNSGTNTDSSNVPVAVSPIIVTNYYNNNVKTIYNTFEIGGNFNNAITNNYLEIYTESKYLSTDSAYAKSFSGFYPNHLNIKNTITSSKIQFLNSNDEVDLSIGTNQIELNNDVNISNTTQSTDSLSGALVVSGGVGIAKNTYIGGHLNIDSDINITGNYLQNGSILKTGYWEESDNKIYYDSGNVGIGITDPQEKLDINGNLNITGNYLQNGTLLKTGYWEESDNKIYYDSGNVGIGTTDPQEKLEVLGNVNINGILNVDNDININKNALINKAIIPFDGNEYYTLNNKINTHNNIWTQLGIDIDGENAQDEAGFSVSLSADGSVIAIGARKNDDSGNNSGNVRVFKFVSKIWTQMGSSIKGDAVDDESGYSVSLNSNGKILAVSSPNYDDNGLTNSGQVKIYNFVDNEWTQLGESIKGDLDYSRNGYSISLNSIGNIIAIGEAYYYGSDSSTDYYEKGRVRVYKLINNVWSQLGQNLVGLTAKDYFGKSVSLNYDGSILAIGATGSDSANGLNDVGSVITYQYSENNNTWIQMGDKIYGKAEIDPESEGEVTLYGLNNDISLSSNEIYRIREIDLSNSNLDEHYSIINGSKSQSTNFEDMKNNFTNFFVSIDTTDGNALSASNSIQVIFTIPSSTYFNTNGGTSISKIRFYFAYDVNNEIDASNYDLGTINMVSMPTKIKIEGEQYTNLNQDNWEILTSETDIKDRFLKKANHINYIDRGRSNNKKHPSNIDLLNPQILINEQEIDDVKPYIELDVENDNNYNENLGRIRFTFTENSVSKIQGRICIKDIKYYGYSDVAENIETQTDIIIHKDGYKNLKLIDTPLTKLKDNSIDSDNQIKLNYISGKTRTMALGYDILKEELPNNNNLQSLEITENDISISLNSPYEVGDTVEYIVGGMGKMISPETIDNVILYGRYAHQYPSNLDILPHLRYDSNNPNDYVNEYNLFSIELGTRDTSYTQEYSEDKWYISSSSEVFPHYINFDNTTLRNQQAKIQSFKIYQGVYESSSGSYTELSEFAPRCFALFGSNDVPDNNKRSAYGMDLIYCTATDYDEFLNSLSMTSENNTTIDITTFTNLDPTYKTYVILGSFVFYVTHLGGTLGCTFEIPLSRQKHYKYHRLLIFDNFSNFNNDKNIIIGHITIYGQDLQDKGVLVSPSNQPNNILPNSNNKSILHYNPIFFINGHNTTMNRDQTNGWSIRRFFNSNTFYTTGNQFKSNSASVPLSDVVQPTFDSSNNHYYITMGYNNNIIQTITGDNIIYANQNNIRPGMIQHNKSHTMMFYVDTTFGVNDINNIYLFNDVVYTSDGIHYYIIGSGADKGKLFFLARVKLGGNVFGVLFGQQNDYYFKGVITIVYEENINDDTLASIFVYKDGVLSDSYNNFSDKYYSTKAPVSDGIRIGAYGGSNALTDSENSGNFNLYGLATFDRALTSTEINEITKDMLNEPIAAPYRQNFRTQYSINSDSKLYDGNNLLNNYTTNKTRYSLGNTSSINFNFDLKTEIPIKYVDIFPTNNQSTYFPQNFILEGLGENDSNWSNATELLSDSNTFSTVSNQSILINDSSNLTSVRLNITNTDSFRYLRLKCSNIVGAASTSSDSNSDDNYIELGGIRIISEKTLTEGDISNYNKFYGLTDSTNHQTGDLNKLFNGKNNFPENILSIKYQNPNNLNDTLQYYSEGYKIFDYNIFNKSDDINIDIDIKRDIKFAGSSVFFQKDVNFYYPKNINIYGSTDNNSWTLLKNNNNILITDSGTNNYTRINTSTRLIENLIEPYETNNKYRYIRFNLNTLTDSNLTTPDIFFKIKNFGDYRLGDLEIYEWKGKEYEQMNETDNFIEMVFTIHKQFRLSELNIFPNNINANNDPNNFLFLKDFKVYGSNDRQSIQRNKNWTQIYDKQLTIPISDFDGNYTTNTITDSNTALISFFDENLINTYTYYKIKIYNRYNDSYNQTTPFLNIGELLFKKLDSVIVPDNYSIDLSVDGYTLAIGSPLNNILNQNKGYVRIYKWINNSWNQLGSDIEGNNNLNQTGYSLSLNANGTIIAIGSPGNSSGFVSIYQWFNNTWNQIGTDIIGEGISDQSGFSVSINADGTTIGIGARLNDGNGLDAGHVRVYSLGELFTSINIEGDINVNEKCLIGNLKLENNKLSSLNGNLILLPGNLGRIGINQDNPQEKLDINGNTLINGNILINGDLNIKGNTKFSYFNFLNNEISSITENIILSPFNSSNVGIGTNNPQTTLHVAGSTIIEENINISGIGTINNIEINNNKISSKIENIILSPFENTKVGIRTENPIQEIHLEGNTLINGNINTTGIGTISNIEINNNIISSKDSDNIIIIPNNNSYLGIDQKIPEEKIDIAGGIKFKGSLNANNIFDISCGVNHTAILLNTGKILTFGNNQHGQLVLNSFDSKVYPTSIDETRSNYDGTNAIQVIASNTFTIVLLKTGEILTGGLNQRNGLGDNTPAGNNIKRNFLSPILTTGTSDSDYNGTNAIFICVGDRSYAALLKTGKVITWGIGQKYNLGRNVINNQPHPPGQVDEDKSDYNGTNAVSISVGFLFMLILLNTGKIISFGNNHSYGQLGVNQSIPGNPYEQFEVDSANGYKKNNAIAIDSGYGHSLILLNNGKVLSFGLNDNGQLGDGSTVNSNIPIEITYTNGYNGFNASYISCGNKHSIILLNTGKVLTFGLNDKGQLGNGSTTNSYIPIEPSYIGGYDGTNCIKISLNSSTSDSTSLILNTGVILACGKNFSNTFDNMDTENGDYEGPELKIMNINGMHQINIGSYNITPKFNLYANTYINGMLNVNMISSISENIILDPENSSNVGIGINEPQEKLDINGNLKISGHITTKILNQFTENEIKSIATGYDHSMILLNTGKVLSFGNNASGQLGDSQNSGDSSNVLVAVNTSSNVGYNGSNAIAIAGGGYNSMILLNTGKVLTFGANGFGQIGDGTNTDSNNVPVAVSTTADYDGENAIAISSGENHSMILLNTGKILSFGDNQFGQLGDSQNSGDSSNVPVAVSTTAGYDGENAIVIACGASHSMILLNTGKVLSFGNNFYGGIGDGSTTQRNVPVAVSTTAGYDGENAIAIAAGGFYSMILLNTGKVLTFGGNGFGQLGDASTTQRNEPVAVSTSSNVGYDGENAIAIDCSGSHSMILLNTGKVLSFGRNNFGQLGDSQNSGDSSNVPVEVSTTDDYDGKNAIAIISGDAHSIILLNTGKVLSFGYNSKGQLGDGTNNDSNVPVAVDSANGYTQDNLKTIYNTFEIGDNFNNAITNNYFEIYRERNYSSTDDAETKSFSGFYPNHLNIKNKKSSSKIQFLNSNDEVDLSITSNQIKFLKYWNFNSDSTSTLDIVNNNSVGIQIDGSGGGSNGITFTGQHLNLLNKNINDNFYGLIVSSTGNYINLENNLKPTINESLPVCEITNIENDKRIFGVISSIEDDNRYYETGNIISIINKYNNNERRMQINSLGEGGIWVCNKNGIIENGDYISSSSIPGYGMKQILEEGTLKNYTVAKITCDCNFSLNKIIKQKLKINIINNNNNLIKNIDYDDNGDVQYEDDLNDSGNQQLEYQYDTRFLLPDATQITEEEYNTKLQANEEVYIACFVGCTYHCG